MLIKLAMEELGMTNLPQFVHYEMENTSTRKNYVNNIRIKIIDTFTDEVIGTARMEDFVDIVLEMQGDNVCRRYKLSLPALRYLEKKGISNMTSLFERKWLFSEGEWIIKNMVRIAK